MHIFIYEHLHTWNTKTEFWVEYSTLHKNSNEIRFDDAICFAIASQLDIYHISNRFVAYDSNFNRLYNQFASFFSLFQIANKRLSLAEKKKKRNTAKNHRLHKSIGGKKRIIQQIEHTS